MNCISFANHLEFILLINLSLFCICSAKHLELSHGELYGYFFLLLLCLFWLCLCQHCQFPQIPWKDIWLHTKFGRSKRWIHLKCYTQNSDILRFPYYFPTSYPDVPQNEGKIQYIDHIVEQTLQSHQARFWKEQPSIFNGIFKVCVIIEYIESWYLPEF